MNKNKRSTQSGLTFMGFIFIIMILVLVGALVLRIYPLYYEKFQVINSMKTVSARPDASTLTAGQVRTYFLKNIEITNIRRFDGTVKEHVKVLKGKKGEPNKIRVRYNAENVFFRDLFFTLKFDETMPLGTTAGDD